MALASVVAPEVEPTSLSSVIGALPTRPDMERGGETGGCWTNLLETTFNKVNDILGDVCVVEEMMEEDMIEQAVSIDLLSNSRLDANSVLIDDIKLGEEANMEMGVVTRDRSYSWHGGNISSSCSTSPARSCTSSGSGGSLAPVSEALRSMSSEEEERGGSSSGGESNEMSTRAKLKTRKNPWGTHSYAELIVQVHKLRIDSNFRKNVTQ